MAGSRADPLVHGLVSLGGTPAQIAVEHIPDHVVRVNAVRAGLGDGKRAQPAQQGVRVLAGQDRAQQVHGGGVRVGADFQGVAVGGRGHLADQVFQERRVDVLRGRQSTVSARWLTATSAARQSARG
ncbi:hypothetical protein [Streptomyces sp. NBC_01643]|uniref:hypothetical protein n=1 Tax=Streptomyces sp. NBC_01643 TaxID=2975906 RepID=UPI00386F82A3|nr:hypothetical protein OHB03_44710 [Streptomyces sp. NBC_01643]